MFVSNNALTFAKTHQSFYIMKSLFISFFLLLPFLSYTQKHDFLWALGVGPKVNPSSPKTFFFNFHTDPPSILLRNDSVPTVYTASYSNEKGEIIAFTNGLRMYNKNGQLMENGEGLNLTLHKLADSLYYTYPTTQSAFFWHILITRIVCILSAQMRAYTPSLPFSTNMWDGASWWLPLMSRPIMAWARSSKRMRPSLKASCAPLPPYAMPTGVTGGFFAPMPTPIGTIGCC